MMTKRSIWIYLRKMWRAPYIAAMALIFIAAVFTGYYAAKGILWKKRLPLLSEVADQIGLSSTPMPGAEAYGELRKADWSPQWPDPYPAATFRLRDQDGKEAALADFSGKVVVMSFIYTNCQSACPLIAQELSGLQKQLASSMGKEVFFLSITIDPDRDTPEALRKFGEAHGANFLTWKFLTGQGAEIKKVLTAYNVHAEKEETPKEYEFGHSNPIYLIDQWGRIRKRLDPGLLSHRGFAYIAGLVEEGKRH